MDTSQLIKCMNIVIVLIYRRKLVELLLFDDRNFCCYIIRILHGVRQWCRFQFLLVRLKNGAPKERKKTHFFPQLIIVGIINFREVSFMTREVISNTETICSLSMSIMLEKQFLSFQTVSGY